MSTEYFIVRQFVGYSHRQNEVQVIGPFESREIATRYKKATGKGRPKSMMDSAAGPVKITTRPPADNKGRAYYRMLPSEDIMSDIL